MVATTQTPLLKGIGSVIPAADPGDSPSSLASVRSVWTTDHADSRAFATARAALAALLIARRITRLWLPAYSCRTLADGALAAGVDLAWYGTDDRLNPDVTTVRTALADGDAVLAIAWFGRPPDPAFQHLAADHPDLLIIEDRAQALDPRGGIDGAVRLYSPRKLLGVADGGILVGDDLPQPPTQPAWPDVWTANDARRADPDGLAPPDWFPDYQSRETGFDATPRRCSDRTLTALDHIDLPREADARRRNWQALAGPLDRLALWSIPAPDFAPLAFPVVVADAAALVAYLADRRIWAARHWADLPSPETFAAAYDLARRCVSLPLDSRYGPQDMQRVSEAVLDFVTAQPLQAGGAR
jgi:dTDP-4-amino-4,6-dideoxygalactose transaminase